MTETTEVAAIGEEREAQRIEEINAEIAAEIAESNVDLSADEIVPRTPFNAIADCIAGVMACIERDKVGYRIFLTQEKGKILNPPIIKSQTDSWFSAADLVDELKLGDSDFAIAVPVYGCGHDHLQWDQFWEDQSIKR